MDLQQLHGVFSATLAADAGARTQAEATLKDLGAQASFSEGCLDLLMAPDVENPIKIAAGVYLKNHVTVSWKQNKPANAVEVRLKLLHGLSTAQSTFRSIFLVVLHRIIEIDYPESWPDLVPKVHEMLSSEDAQTVWAGLSAALKVFFWYRYRALKNFDSVVSSLYPVILGVAEHATPSDTPLAAAMLYDFAKIYKYATARTLPTLLQNLEVIGRSTQIFVRVLQKPGEEFGKAKKWSSFALLRTHIAYVSSVTGISDKANALAPFRKAYSEQLTPHVLQAVLTLLEQWSQKQLWLPPPAICNLLTYLEGTPNNKEMWTVVEPFVDGLLLHVVYPLLCPTQDDLVLFKEEPVEFIHKRAAAAFEQLVPDQAAENLLLQLVQRRKTAFERVITFIQERRQESVAEQVGTLRMLDIISRVILMKNNPVQASMETYLVGLDLKSEPIVRSQIVHLIGTYAPLQFSREALQRLYMASLEALWDENLPVQVDAARALQSLAEHDDVKAAIGEHIPRILQHLLDLTKKIDLDSLLEVMDVFIEMHPEQVTPFAVELVAQLRDQFLAVASELAEAANMPPDQFNLEDDDFLAEKRDTAGSILRTVENLQYSLEKHTDILRQLEAVIAPIFQAVYEHELMDFYPETLALHENTMYSTKSVSPLMWNLLPMVIQAVQAGGFECLDDANAVFENYISYGKDVLAQEQRPRDLIMGLVVDILAANILTVQDWIQVLQLAKMALCTSELRSGPMNAYLEPLLGAVLAKIGRDSERWQTNHHYAVGLVSVVQACIYNSPASLEYLRLQNAAPAVASLWIHAMPSIKNVENLKLQELAILVILGHQPPEWEQFYPKLLQALAYTIETLPGAIARLEEQRKAFDEDDVDFGAEADDWDDIDEGFADDLNVQNETPAEFVAATSLSAEKHEFIAFDFSEDRDANPYLVSPLDSLDPFSVLKQTFGELADQKPEWYAALMGMLSERERAILQDGALRA